MNEKFNCPTCKKSLIFQKYFLFCENCKKKFPIIEGVFDFSEENFSKATYKTLNQFAKSWKIFDHIKPYHQKQFLEWIFPENEEIFKDKVVLEAGCGKGRHTYIVSTFGAKKIYAVDLSDAIFVAKKNINQENCLFIKSDIRKLPFEENFFDVVFCIGVLHHIENMDEAFFELWRVLKKGGKLLLWVYAKEGNWWILKFVNPIRKNITSKIDPKLLRIVSFPISLLLFLLLKIFYGPLSFYGKKVAPILPYSSYLSAISPFPFREVESIVVDHLCPEIAYYLSKEEIENMISKLKPKEFTLRLHRKNSWTIILKK